MGENFDEIYMENSEEYETYFKKHNIRTQKNDIISKDFLSDSKD